jgi:hypothetical protein
MQNIDKGTSICIAHCVSPCDQVEDVQLGRVHAKPALAAADEISVDLSLQLLLTVMPAKFDSSGSAVTTSTTRTIGKAQRVRRQRQNTPTEDCFLLSQ